MNFIVAAAVYYFAHGFVGFRYGNETLDGVEHIIEIARRMQGAEFDFCARADVSGQQAPTRQLMLRAQFERFKYIHRNARGVLLSWDRNPLLFAFRLHHGRPTLLPWRNLIRQGRNNVRNIAVYAFRRLGGTNEAWDLLRRVAQRANVDDDDIGPMPLP